MLPPAENWSKDEGDLMRRVSKSQAIARMTHFVIEQSLERYRLEPLVSYDSAVIAGVRCE